MAVKYRKQVEFPQPFIPGASELGIKDPFGATLDQAGGGPEQIVGGGGGGGIPDLDVVRAKDGTVISTGTETLTIGGKSIYWVQYEGVTSGVRTWHLKLASLPYSTEL